MIFSARSPASSAILSSKAILGIGLVRAEADTASGTGAMLPPLTCLSVSV